MTQGVYVHIYDMFAMYLDVCACLYKIAKYSWGKLSVNITKTWFG